MDKPARILALVPARGGSKRLPRKNVLPLGGQPLIQWSIQAAMDSGVCADVLVSTDDAEIAEVAAQCGAMVPWLRPESLSTDTAATAPVIAHALDWYERTHGSVDVVLLLQPTSPFRTASSIRAACQTFFAQDDGTRFPVVSVSPAPMHPAWTFYLQDGAMTPCQGWEPFGLRSQDLPQAFSLNGALYLIPAADVRSGTPMMRPGVRPFVMSSAEESLDIDTPQDWAEAERLLASRAATSVE